MAELLTTARLVLRDWELDDAAHALAVYGHRVVRPWMAPVLQEIPDESAMRDLLAQWAEEQHPAGAVTGHWAIVTRTDRTPVGGIALRALPADADLELAFQLRPDYWGNGYAAEAARALAGHAFDADVEELFALVRHSNTRAAGTAMRIGMQWVGETDKYYGLALQVYRLRPAELVTDDDLDRRWGEA